MDENTLLQAIEKMLDEKLDAKLDAKLEPIKADISEIKQRVTKIEITQENEILPRLQLLAEGDSALHERVKRLEKLPPQVEELKITVAALKQAVKENQK